MQIQRLYNNIHILQTVMNLDMMIDQTKNLTLFIFIFFIFIPLRNYAYFGSI